MVQMPPGKHVRKNRVVLIPPGNTLSTCVQIAYVRDLSAPKDNEMRIWSVRCLQHSTGPNWDTSTQAVFFVDACVRTSLFITLTPLARSPALARGLDGQMRIRSQARLTPGPLEGATGLGTS